MYAIVECGGRQYRAEEGHTFSVEKLSHEVGDQITLNNVFLLSNGEGVQVGQPTVDGVSVLATVTEQYRGKKIFVWKYKPKKRYRRRRGHRQSYTRLRIDSILTGGQTAPATAEVVAFKLTKIEGIGPKISSTLNAAGIGSFEVLAATSAGKLSQIVAAAGISAVTKTWPQQAALAAAGKWDELQDLQDRLDGGREVA
ncbi:MAG: 50S ribosomal protein L21 [Candidatus Promineifilaceae bacterium]